MHALLSPNFRRAVLASALSFVSAATVVTACGGSSTEVISRDAGTGLIGPDSGRAAIADAGSDSSGQSVYPATHPALPLVEPPTLSGSAHVMGSQKIVTILFPNDPLGPRLEAFTDYIGTSDWWTATSSEYCTGPGGTCIGPSQVLEHVQLTDPSPTVISSAGVETYIQGLIDQGLVPPPAADVIYTLFFPENVQIGDPGFMSCSYFDGYHSSMMATQPPPDGGTDPDAAVTGGSVQIEYAVLARCSGSESETTLATAHELLEAATDPDGYGYNITDPAWAAFFYSEVGDLCDFEPAQYIGAQFVVQSGWSNASAKAGHNPCVPNTPGTVYFNVAPAQSAIILAVGSSTTIDVYPFSEGPTSDWNVSAVDYSAEEGLGSYLDLSLDTATVNNGSPAHLTIKLLAAPPTSQITGEPGAVLAIVSRQGQTQHMWPAVVLAN